MDLFGADPKANLLPHDGETFYHGPVFSGQDIERFTAALTADVPWQRDEIRMFGKRIVTGRKVAWFANEGLSYAYSGTTKQPHPWNTALLEIRESVQRLSGASYNSCLLNLYHDGAEGMGWHSDDERSIVAESSIASLSFGAERKFSFKHKQSKETVSLMLENGSLLDMRGGTQENWWHQLPKTKRVSEPRINLTFRRMVRNAKSS
jgi:alkylated DNA repair dioxygenase AlkB